ncbi:uncharacterized protein LOC117649178 [Thrips palmi]|nr:uncharacterized protein LOC117649178 [Thrips palmi]
MPGTPVKTKKELAVLERFLENSENVTSLSIMLSCFVNKEPNKEYKSVMRVLRNVMDNAVAKYYSFDGKGVKRGFKELKLWQSVQGAVLSKVENSDLQEAERAARSWLRNAPYRKQGDGSKSKREASKDEQHGEKKKKKKAKKKKSS